MPFLPAVAVLAIGPSVGLAATSSAAVAQATEHVPEGPGFGVSVMGLSYLSGLAPGLAFHVPLRTGAARPPVLDVWASPLPGGDGWTLATDARWVSGHIQLGAGVMLLSDGGELKLGPGLLLGMQFTQRAESRTVRYAGAYRVYAMGGGLPVLSFEIGVRRWARGDGATSARARTDRGSSHR